MSRARAPRTSRTAARYGVVIEGEIKVDMARVKARKDEVIGASREGVEQWLRATPNVTVFKGHARFTAPHSLRIDGTDGAAHDIDAGMIFINTGTRAAVPAIDGLRDVPYLTNATILELTEVPAHLVIVGASYIALEFGQMFRRFGSRVTLLVRGERILSREDADIARAMQDVLTREGIEFRFEPSRAASSGRTTACVFRSRTATVTAARPSTHRICSLRPGARRIPTISGSTARVSR